MSRYLADRPWLFIVAGFAILVSVWTCFLYVAVTRGPLGLPLSSDTPGIHANR